MTQITRRAALAGATILAGTRFARAQAKPDVKLAMLVPLSGPWARSGQDRGAGEGGAAGDLGHF